VDRINLYLGIMGMICLLTAFVLNLVRVLRENAYLYIILNIAGASLSTYYAVTLNAIPFIILEGVWTFFAVYKLGKVLITDKRLAR